MSKYLKKLNIEENDLTKPIKRPKVFSKFKNNVPHHSGLNEMSDILILPKTKNKNIALLVVVDLWGGVDFQPIQNKTANTILEAYKQILKRKFIKLPEYTMQTDNGGEFQGNYDAYLYNNNIYHKVSKPYRHSQNSPVENMNKLLGHILNAYMNQEEEKTGKKFVDWDDENLLKDIRNLLNTERKKVFKDINPRSQIYPKLNMNLKPKFNKGDIVLIKSEIPLDSFGNKQADISKWREGDYRFNRFEKREIDNIIRDPDVEFRYTIKDDKKPVSYADYELLKVEGNATFIVDRILNIKQFNKITKYLIKWKGYKIADATWETKEDLVKDVGLEHLIKLINNYKKRTKTK